ncbi:amino acid permease [Brevibacterium sp. VCM10]|uniref:amino acid permease n=1 Tax=Brevibacterium sp. VCM10 TaxID=1381751 RepID=UPI00046F828C
MTPASSDRDEAFPRDESANGREENAGLERGLTARHIRLMALGSAIGTGLFMGSSESIQAAGPAVLLAYVIGGAAVFMVMRALGELVVRHPVSGSFGQYASRYIHPFAGFLVGWTFAFEMVLVAVFDATAIGVYMGFWFPDVPRWIWVLAVVFFIAAINMLGVKVFGELEFWFALIKIAAIIILIVAGVAIIIVGFGIADHDQMGPQALFDHGGFFPNGLWGLLSSFTIVMFAFGGVEIIGVTAGEAQNPKQVIPAAINSVPVRILLFYVLTLGVIMCILPWNQITSEISPFVAIFDSVGFTAAAAILQVVLITAALSAMNADIFGAGRMLYGLAEQGQAPRSFARTSPGGVPVMTVVTMIIALLAGVVLNYLYPDQALFLLGALATFATVLVWLIILASHIRMKKVIAEEARLPSEFPVPLWPVGSWITLAFIVFIVVMVGVVPDSRPALWVGLLWVVALWLCYLAFVRGQGRRPIDLTDRTEPISAGK